MSGFARAVGPGRLTKRQRYDRVHRAVRAARRRLLRRFDVVAPSGRGVGHVYEDQYEREQVEALVAALVRRPGPRVYLWVLSGIPRLVRRAFYRERRWYDRLP